MKKTTLSIILAATIFAQHANASEVPHQMHGKPMPERRNERGELVFNDSNIPQFNDTNFQHMVLESSDTFVIGFMANWCDPCHILFPSILEEVYGDMNHEITVATMDVDVSPQTTMNYGIRNIPTVLIFKAGKFVGMHEYPDIYDLRSWIDGVLKESTVKEKTHFQKR